MAFLSIIIPVYNTAEFLPKCLDSILAQTFTDIEIICVENNSTDSSPQILQHYAQKDSRIRLYHQPTPGQSAARNMGLQYATGQYIGFVDSDDAIDSHYYQQLCQAAQKTSADIICTGCQTVFIGALPVPVYYLPYTLCQDWTKRWQIDIAVWAKIYKKEFLQTHRFHFMPGVIWEDVLWTFKTLYQAHKIITLPGNGYFYTRNPLGTMALSKTKNRKHTLYSIKTVYQAAQDFITQNEPSFSRKKILNEFLIKYLFFDSVLQDDPSLIKNTSWLTRWKRSRNLLLQKHYLCCLQQINYHNNWYYVLRLLGTKIRLWKVPAKNPCNF